MVPVGPKPFRQGRGGKEFKMAVKITEYEGVPTLEITLPDGRTGYLAPFRGYCFQVSKSLEGEYDLGSTSVVGLGNFIGVQRTPNSLSIYSSNGAPLKGVLADLATLAVIRWAGQNGEEELWANGPEFEEYIDRVISWLRDLHYSHRAVAQ